ncbi:hypothetical protein L218DRAFT_985861 [Marasmius fiardii PR-910]|nr:hypothetical protein L218DRAFT_985861 [Marasmius fiardii PR-910]
MDVSFRSLHHLKSTILDSLGQIISPRLSVQNKIQALQNLESLFVHSCLRKEKGKGKDGQNSADFDRFLALQATFECNIISHLLPFISICNTRLQQLVAEGVEMDAISSDNFSPQTEDYCEKLRPISASSDSENRTPNEDNLKQEAQSLYQALNISTSLIQGLVLNHAASKEWIGRKGSLEVVIDLLLVSRYFSPSSQEASSNSHTEKGVSTTLTAVVLDTLLCILAPSPSTSTAGYQFQLEDGVNALRNFEEVQGLQAVVKILKRKGSGRAVRMKCLEFLYFYLLDETSPKFTGVSASADLSSSTTDPNGPPPLHSPDKHSATSKEMEQSHSAPSSSSNSTSTPPYPISRNLHSRSRSQTDSSFSTPVPSTPSTPFTNSHARTPSSRAGSGPVPDSKPHSRNTKKPWLTPLSSNDPSTPSIRSERPDRPPTPISRYGSSTYAFSSASPGGTFSTSSIPNSRNPSSGIQPHLRSHSRSGSIARSPSTRSNSPDKTQSRFQNVGEGGSVPSSRSVSSSSAASAFSATSEASTAPSSVHSSPRKCALSVEGDEDAPTEKEDERKGHSRSHSHSNRSTPAAARSNVGPGGIGLGRPGVSVGVGTRAQTPHTPQPYLDFVPATPAPKVKSRRTADGPSTPAPKLGQGAPATHFAKTPAPVKMKKAGSESVIGVSGLVGHARTKSALGRASSLGDMESEEGGADGERGRERERRKEDAFWDFEAQSPQKKSFPDGISSDDRKPSNVVTATKPQMRTTKEKTAILGTMLGNVDALVRSLEGVRLG